jgi:plastocyanin
MRYRTVKAFILLASLVSCLGGCGINPGGAPPTSSVPLPSDGASTARPETPPKTTEANRVVIDNFTFSPREITVAPGTRVTWVNRDDAPHTVTSTAQPRLFDSGALDDELPFAFVFRTPGMYDYFCALHPHMTGKVIVK